METGESQGRDENFLQKLTQIVLDNLINEQFSVKDLAPIAIGVGFTCTKLP